MKVYKVKNIIVDISRDDLIKMGMLKSENLVLIRLTSNDLNKTITELFLTGAVIEIIDYSYYGVYQSNIRYDVKYIDQIILDERIIMKKIVKWESSTRPCPQCGEYHLMACDGY